MCSQWIWDYCNIKMWKSAIKMLIRRLTGVITVELYVSNKSSQIKPRSSVTGLPHILLFAFKSPTINVWVPKYQQMTRSSVRELQRHQRRKNSGSQEYSSSHNRSSNVAPDHNSWQATSAISRTCHADKCRSPATYRLENSVFPQAYTCCHHYTVWCDYRWQPGRRCSLSQKTAL